MARAPKLVPSLDHSVLDLKLLRDNAEEALVGVVGQLPEPVCLVHGNGLMNIFRLVLARGLEPLLDAGLHSEGIMELGRDPHMLPGSASSTLFLIRPTPDSIEGVLRHLRWKQHHPSRSRRRADSDASGEFEPPRDDPITVDEPTFIAFVPAPTMVCEQLLRDAGVLDQVTMLTVDVDLFPVDDDILSMEMPETYHSLSLEGDRAPLDLVTNSILNLQAVFGPIPRIKAKGVSAERVLGGLLRRRAEQMSEESAVSTEAMVAPSSSAPTSSASRPTRGGAGRETQPNVVSGGEIDHLIILDRHVDPITPLLSPLTVEAVVDDLVGIEQGRIRVPRPEVLLRRRTEEVVEDDEGDDEPTGPAGEQESQRDGSASREVLLNSDSKVYASVRDMSVAEVSHKLRETAAELSRLEEQSKELRDKEVAEIREYADKLPEILRDKQDLARMIDIVKAVTNVTNSDDFREQWLWERAILETENADETLRKLEMMVAEGLPPIRILRLLCLASLTWNGLPGKQVDSIRHSFLHTYGAPHLLTLIHLERVGLLQRRERSGIFGTAWSASAGPGDSRSWLPVQPWDWSALRSGLRCINEEFGRNPPSDTSYVTAGYAPLSARLVELALRSEASEEGLVGADGQLVDDGLVGKRGWAACEALRQCSGGLFEMEQLDGPATVPAPARDAARDHHTQRHVLPPAPVTAKWHRRQQHRSPADVRARHAAQAEQDSAEDAMERMRRRVVVVFFIGGVSYVEIAAMRFLSEILPFDIVCASTHITNGNRMMKTMMHYADMEKRRGGLQPGPTGPSLLG